MDEKVWGLGETPIRLWQIVFMQHADAPCVKQIRCTSHNRLLNTLHYREGRIAVDGRLEREMHAKDPHCLPTLRPPAQHFSHEQQ